MKTRVSKVRGHMAAFLIALALGVTPAGMTQGTAQQATPEPQDPCLNLPSTAGRTSGMHGAMRGQSTPMAGAHGQGVMAGFDLMFIDMMIPHHQEAVDMATVVLLRSTNPEVRDLAEAIITAQNTEIALMNDWRAAWYPDAGTPTPFSDGMGMMAGGAGMMMMPPGEMLTDLCESPDIDLAFLELMIPHHESAIVMAEVALTNAEHDELVNLAEAILATQSAEIDLMRNVIAQLSGTPVASN